MRLHISLIIKVVLLWIYVDFSVTSSSNQFQFVNVNSNVHEGNPPLKPVPSRIVKRDGSVESIDIEKIRSRVVSMSQSLSSFVDPEAVVTAVVRGLTASISVKELDTLISETAAYMSTDHPAYAKLAANIAVSQLHSCEPPSLVGCFCSLLPPLPFSLTYALPRPPR